MKFDKQILGYLLLVVMLLLAIVILYSKNNFVKKSQNLLLDGANQLVTGKKLTSVPNSDPSIVKTKGVLRTFEGIEEKDNNIVGIVKDWDGENSLISVIIDTKVTTFYINPNETRMMLVKTKNMSKDESLKVIDKYSEPLEWLHAFCIDDPVSLLVQPETNKVRLIIDSGLRVCGYDGGTK